MGDSINCIFRTCGCSVLLFIIIGIPIIVSLHTSSFKDHTFFLDQISLTSFNLTPDGHLTGMFGVVMRIENPNHKYMTNYKDIRIKIYKDGQQLAKDKVKIFTQHKGNVIVFRAEPIALNITLKKGPVFDFGMEKGMGYLQFGVVSKSYRLYVYCLGTINVSPFSPMSNINAQSLRSTKCSVRIYEDNGTA